MPTLRRHASSLKGIHSKAQRDLSSSSIDRPRHDRYPRGPLRPPTFVVLGPLPSRAPCPRTCSVIGHPFRRPPAVRPPCPRPPCPRSPPVVGPIRHPSGVRDPRFAPLRAPDRTCGSLAAFGITRGVLAGPRRTPPEDRAEIAYPLVFPATSPLTKSGRYLSLGRKWDEVGNSGIEPRVEAGCSDSLAAMCIRWTRRGG